MTIDLATTVALTFEPQQIGFAWEALHNNYQPGPVSPGVFAHWCVRRRERDIWRGDRIRARIWNQAPKDGMVELLSVAREKRSRASAPECSDLLRMAMMGNVKSLRGIALCIGVPARTVPSKIRRELQQLRTEMEAA